MIEIIYFLLSVSLIFFSMLGYGLVLNNNFIKNDLFFTLTAGYFFLGLFALILHFFSPITDLTSIFILIFGLLIFFFKSKDVSFKKIVKKVSFMLIIALLLILYTDHPIDTNMYHHPYVSYLNSEKIIFGIAEIQFRFGHISFLQYVQAISSNRYIHELTLAAPNLILYSFFIFYCFDIILRENKKKLLYLSTLLISSFILIKFSRYREFGNDILPFIISSYVFLNIISQIFYPSKDRIKIMMLSPLFVIFIFTHKISYLFVCLIFLCILEKNDLIKILKNKFIILPFFTLSLAWLTKNYISTSCLAYPITFTCIENSSWYLTGVASPQNASWLTELWSKDFITNDNWKNLNLENYINTFAWIPNWLNNHFVKILEKLSPLFIMIFIISTYLIIAKKNRSKNLHSYRLIILIFLTFIGLTIWFLNAPTFRYGSFYIVSFIILIFILIFKNIIDKVSFKNFEKMKSLLLISIIFFSIKNLTRITPGEGTLFPQTKIILKEYKKFKSGDLTVLKPKNLGVCYYSGFICSHELRNETIFIKKNKYLFLNNNN